MPAEPTTPCLYLNHAGTSWPKPQVVTEAIQFAATIAPFHWLDGFEKAHQSLADFFAVGTPDQILLTPGCTSALGVALSDTWIPVGKRVLTSRWEHHALHRPLLKRAVAGLQIDYIPPEKTSAVKGSPRLIDLQWLENELSNLDVGLVAITAACNVTGELLPYAEVIELAHQYDAMVLIDAAQLVGWQKLDLPNLGADLVAFGGHKGLQGPWGIGGLYLSNQVQMECVSATCQLPDSSSPRSHVDRPGYCDVGSVDRFALAGLHAAIQMLSQQNLSANLEQGRQQIRRLRERLERFKGLNIFGGQQDGMPTVAFGIPGLPSGKVASHLSQYGLVVGSGLQCAPIVHETLGTQDFGLVRLSVGVGQSDAEINEAIDQLAKALEQII